MTQNGTNQMSRNTTTFISLQGLICLFWANPGFAELQPRDLDQNPATIEAYYDTELDVTWLANANIARDESFSIPTAADAVSCNTDGCNFSRPGIDEYGLMEWPTADQYMVALNANSYLGQTDWRLSTARWNERPFPQYSYYSDEEIPNIQGSAYALQIPNYERADRYLTSNIGEDGNRIYVVWGSGRSIGTSIYDQLIRFAVWPLLDGDRGTATGPIDQSCVDSDGDGWGWDGVQSCRVDATQTATSTPQWLIRVEPRDLDQNPDTIEAFYDPYQDLTWLANNRLASTEDFGLRELIDSVCNGGGPCRDNISEDGSMRPDTAQGWIDAMNQSGYLGANQWRLPAVDNVFERGFERFENNELRNLYGMTRDDERPQVQDMIADGNYTIGGGDYSRIYIEILTRISTYSGNPYRTLATNDDARYNDRFFAWPVHEGDIGLDAPICVDTDGDGWGWDGSMSCRIADVPPVLTECVDPDGDGWGWDGQASCIP